MAGRRAALPVVGTMSAATCQVLLDGTHVSALPRGQTVPQPVD